VSFNFWIVIPDSATNFYNDNTGKINAEYWNSLLPVKINRVTGINILKLLKKD